MAHPIYGVREMTGFWVFIAYQVRQVTIFCGNSLDPVPPFKSKQKDVRYFHIYEGEEIDKAKFADWVNQALKMPGKKL